MHKIQDVSSAWNVSIAYYTLFHISSICTVQYIANGIQVFDSELSQSFALFTNHIYSSLSFCCTLCLRQTGRDVSDNDTVNVAIDCAQHVCHAMWVIIVLYDSLVWIPCFSSSGFPSIFVFNVCTPNSYQ